jgi:retron-type reverse transcriptase
MHAAMNRFRSFAHVVSKNNTRTCWVLKCDIRKFFASVDHDVMIGILKSHIADKDTVQLLEGVVNSFSSTASGVGLPLGISTTSRN